MNNLPDFIQISLNSQMEELHRQSKKVYDIILWRVKQRGKQDFKRNGERKKQEEGEKRDKEREKIMEERTRAEEERKGQAGETNNSNIYRS